MTFKKIKYAVLMLLMLIIVGCGGTKEKAEKKLDTVDVVLDWYPNAIHCFLYNAIEKGYFEEEGIKVNIHFPSNASDPMALPAAKKADIGIYYLHHLVMARANENIPITSIGAITQKPLNVIIALKENNIKRAKDLERKTIGYSGGPLSEESLKAMVEYDGGDASKVKVIDVGFELLTSMITKQVDATIGGLVNHEVPVMEEKGLPVDYFYCTEYGMPNYYEELFVANDDLIKERKDVYVRFLKAANKGFNDMMNNPEESLDILLAKQEADQFPLSRNVETQSINILLPIMKEEGVPFLHQDAEVWQENINWLYDHKIIDKKVDANEMFINLYEEK
ncbi:ABC transporter substrate-binding protein [Fusobacterium perfoetens]|uniref:ABC transporter substrate-binding protein n=1 Tax=Fusobacterium perfoetens TaxID=852 RepID=UPI001F217248|nr:ABC transporter substrate-binding protein [Fusobacterium perfoetens]MCF2624715.1 ABC transporter substrate-binding protein [Fusobacterium perfoetens]